MVDPLHNAKMMRKFITDSELTKGYLLYHEEAYKKKEDKYDFKEEMVDILIRTLDITSALDMDTYRMIMDKMEENWKRPHLHGRVNH